MLVELDEEHTKCGGTAQVKLEEGKEGSVDAQFDSGRATSMKRESDAVDDEEDRELKRHKLMKPSPSLAWVKEEPAKCNNQYDPPHPLESAPTSEITHLATDSANNQPKSLDNISKEERKCAYIPNHAQRANSRIHPMKDGVLLEAKKSIEEICKEKERAGREIFMNYCNSNVFDINNRLDPVDYRNEAEKSSKTVTITIPSMQRIPVKDGRQIMSLSVSQSNIVAILLSNRSADKLAPKDAKTIIVKEEDLEDVKGRIIAIIHKDCLPDEISKASLSFKENYDKLPTIENKGSKAAIYPTHEQINMQLKCEESNDAAGFKSNVKEIIGLRALPTGTNLLLTYLNHNGEEMTRTFTSNLNRKVFKPSELRVVDDSCGTLFDFVKNVYEKCLPMWFESRGCKKDQVDAEVAATLANLHIAGNLIDQHKNKMGIHTYPPTPTPACAFGHTNHQWNKETNKCDRICAGGNLFFADRMFCLSYGPKDIVLFDCNIAHGVTNLKQSKQQQQQQTSVFSRFSMVLFSKHRKEHMKHYGKYMDDVWHLPPT